MNAIFISRFPKRTLWGRVLSQPPNQNGRNLRTPRKRRSKTRWLQFVCIVVLFGKSAASSPMERQEFKFPISKQAVKRHCCLPLNYIFRVGLWPAAHCRVSIEMSGCGQVVIISVLIFALQVLQHN